MNLRDIILKECFTKTGRSLKCKQRAALVSEIDSATAFLPEDTALSERIYALLQGQTKVARCITCQAPLMPKLKDPQLYCGSTCAANSPLVIEKKKKTNRERYGVEYATSSDVIREKIKKTHESRYPSGHALKEPMIRSKIEQTSYMRYGVANPAQSEEVKEKIKEAHQKLYGVANPAQSEEVKEKIRQTNLDRYGVSNPAQSEEVKEKIRQTNLDRYGVDHIFQSEEVKEKIRQTNLDRYGGSNPAQSEEVKEKIRQTNLDRYGVEYPSQRTDIIQKMTDSCMLEYGVPNPMQHSDVVAKTIATKMEKYGAGNRSPLNEYQLGILRDKEKLDNLYQKYTTLDISTQLGVTPPTVIYHLHSHGIKIKKESYISQEELRWQLLISKIYTGEVIFNTRKLIPPYEIDIYLPELKLAIEYDGIYWHSEGQGKDKNYHLNKTRLCADRGVQLFHIFSSDPIDIWESVISMKLGKATKVGARETQVTDISSADAYIFLLENHLQGPAYGSIRKGLIYRGELIALMTFSKPRFTSNYEYELLRFCTKRGYRVVGGASRLLKHSGVTSCISYANRRWSNGNLYEKLGFEQTTISEPNFFYTQDYQKLYSRIRFQKHKLKDLLLLYDENLSAGQNMINNRYDRVFDCGNLVYSYSN